MLDHCKVNTRLFALQDPAYKAFHSKLMPTVDPAKIIGVRIPALRLLCKEVAKEPQIMTAFMDDLPHRYYEEDNLHGLLINRIKDFEACISALDALLPYVDNWATCDLLRPVVFKKEAGRGVKPVPMKAAKDVPAPDRLLPHIRRWMASEHTYPCRFGIEMLMTYYLDEAFDPMYLEMVAQVYSEEYYVNMMIAWYFATALAKQYEEAVKYIEGKRLAAWTHNKAIQKAMESFRITDEQKMYLKGFRIK